MAVMKLLLLIKINIWLISIFQRYFLLLLLLDHVIVFIIKHDFDQKYCIVLFEFWLDMTQINGQ